MAVCVTIDNQQVQQTVDTPQECQSYILLDGADYSLLVQSYEITPADVLYVFSWGFGAVIFFWSLGYAIGVAKTVINKL